MKIAGWENEFILPVMKLQQPVVSEDYVPSVLVGASCGGSSMSAGILVKDDSNKGDPAARVYIGTSAVAERGGMVTWIMRLNMRGTEGFPTLRVSTCSTSLR